MPETTELQLTEAQIADIEARLKVVYAKWHDPGFTKRLLDRDIPALIRDWRALQAIRQEERRAAFRDAIKTVSMLRSKWEVDGAPTDRLIGADFIVEALEAAANETRKDESHGPTN